MPSLISLCLSMSLVSFRSHPVPSSKGLVLFNFVTQGEVYFQRLDLIFLSEWLGYSDIFATSMHQAIGGGFRRETHCKFEEQHQLSGPIAAFWIQYLILQLQVLAFFVYIKNIYFLLQALHLSGRSVLLASPLPHPNLLFAVHLCHPSSSPSTANPVAIMRQPLRNIHIVLFMTRVS